MEFIESLVEAVKRHNVPCVIIGGRGFDEDDDLVPTRVPDLPVAQADPAGDQEELQQLRAQVQSLTQQLAARAEAPAAEAPAGGGGQVPAGDYGSEEDQDINGLGFEDEKLERKLRRLGWDTIGKLRAGLMEGKLAENKIKKDWLIEVGMKLAGAGPSRAATAPTGPINGAAPGGAEVPGGHSDRPWEERLTLARQKQANLDGLRSELNSKQAELKKYTDKGADVPEALDDSVVELEDSIALVEGQLVAMRWCMNLDVDPMVSLDEALERSNLGPWMATPQPRLAPAGS